MILTPRETNNMQICFQYVTQQPFNRSSVMCEVVLEFAAWNSILRVAMVRVGGGFRLTLILILTLTQL